MSKASINILCPSGHRRKAQMTPNTNLLQVLEDMCNQEDLDSSEWGLTHQRKKCDLTIPWRLSNIHTNALLEMYKLDERRPTSDVTVQLQLPDNSRHTGSFNPSITLQEMLDWYRNQPESVLATLDNSANNSCRVCSYMSEEIIGDYALSNTTLRQLGLTSGAAVIRYHHRSIAEDELKKINERIDEKIRRRQQKTIKTDSVQTPPPSESSTKTNPPPPPPTTMSNPSLPITTTTAPSFNNDQYSIFRDIPASRPTRTTNQQQEPRTLAEALGINIQFDQPSRLQPQQRQTDFSNFKFPESTKGQELYQNDLSNNSQQAQSSKTCDRHTIAYDLSSIPSTRKQTEELPDSFFELTPEDLRSVINTLRQQSNEENPLETRSMRQRAQSARTVAYEHIAIRLVINSNTILQGLFYPNETVSNLIEFARTNLICPQLNQSGFYLYTSPPRLVLSDLNKSLLSYDLIPAAYVYLGHRTVTPLNIQLASNISIGTLDQANEIVTQYVFNRTRAMSEDEKNAASNQNITTETNTTNRPAKRNPPPSNINDKDLRDKFRKFIPGKK